MLAALALLAALAGPTRRGFLPWTPAVNAEGLPGTSGGLNTAFQDGCPIQAPNRSSLSVASTRAPLEGNARTHIDIWVAERESKDAPWGAPQNLGAPVDWTRDVSVAERRSAARRIFREPWGGAGVTCGMGDIYLTRQNPARGWETPEHLGCQSDGGPNTPLDEQGPSYVKTGGPTLYFSSGPDIYRSERHGNGRFGPAEPVAELNSAAMDIQPNVRRDGREIVFASNRGGATAFGGQDIWVATRKGVNGLWSAPVNLGSAVNTAANETRPSLAWAATTLYFGRAPGAPITADIWVTTREQIGH